MDRQTKDPFIEIRDNLRKHELKQYKDTELIAELNKRGYKVSIKEDDEVDRESIQRDCG